MKIEVLPHPRVFHTGPHRIPIKDCGSIYLENDEQITLKDSVGGEYDVTKKSWGYYATPSLNHRLLNFGYKSVLVKSEESRFYIFLVHKNCLSAFESYIQSEGHTIITWLDDGKVIEKVLHFKNSHHTTRKCLCGTEKFTLIHRFKAASKTEKAFAITRQGEYRRDLMRCDSCGHFRSFHDYNDADLYSSEYVETNYGSTGIQKVFEKIVNLPNEKSDNFGRVERIQEFCDSFFGKRNKSVLDIGSGLCVFLYLLKQKNGWNCTALDPDERSATHARSFVQVDAIHADFMKIQNFDRTYDLVTLNKVIEHVSDPIEMLKKVQMTLTKDGILYLEVPDGEMAIKDPDGPDREEFTIDHPHVFSLASLLLAAQKAGFECLKLDRIREPSTKYTIYGFFRKA